MVPVTSLLLPILLSAVFVFILSSIIHMVLPIHRNDFLKLPKEDETADALRKMNIPPGDYMLPKAASPADMRNPAFIEKMKKGPVAIMTVMPSGAPQMGGQLVQWFLYSVVVSLFAGYIGGRALGPGANYLNVFRFVGATAFCCYSMAFIPQSIWFRKNWGSTLRTMFDGFIYALFTAGTFGWLWPK